MRLFIEQFFMKTIIILTAAVLLCGCASVGHKLDESKIDQIKKGVTTRDQVVQLVGSPDQITRDGFGRVTFQYIYSRATTKASTFIPIVGAFAGGANVQSQMLMVTFDTNNVVSDLFSSYGANEVNTGVTTGSSAQMNDIESNKRPK
jgi:outer membrane protein assembly factor BamE (lipoprotein component of BamABCDE complex)